MHSSGCLLGDLGQQVEDGQPDQEAVRSRAGLLPERRTEGDLLRLGQRIEVSQERRAQLVEGPERELGLGLDADRALHPEP